jgi:pSer/pThr/pTyr-binding forkhead associated (FHA) protein
MPKITLKFKNNVLADYHLPLGCSLKIGRKTDNDVVIENLAVSGHHAKIDSVGDTFVFIDLKSKNGSFIKDEKVTSHWLQDGDTIHIGKHSLTFAYFDSEIRPQESQSELDKTMVMDTNEYRNEYRSMVDKGDPKPTSAAAVAAAPVQAPPAEKKKKHVRGYITYLVGGGGTLALKNKITKIGKDPASDIVIQGWRVGKTAATITRTRNGYFFSYVAGYAKPRINNKKITKKPHKLVDADVIGIGAFKLKFFNKKAKKSAAQ